MPGFLDRLIPQPKVNKAPTAEPVAPIIEAPKPVEVVVPIPEFSNSQSGTPFETPVAFAKKYYEAAVNSGELTPELQAKMAAYVEITNILAPGWQAEQEANAAAEKAKDPVQMLEESLVKGISRKGGILNPDRSQDQIHRQLEYRFRDLKTVFDQTKLISDKSDMEIIQDIISTGKFKNTFDISELTGGYGGYNTGFPPTEVPFMMKALNVLPENAPEGNNFPRGQEDNYLAKLLQKSGASSKEVKMTLNQMTTDVTEFTKPTSVEGVNLTVGLRSSNLGENARQESNQSGFAFTTGIKLELTPQFLAKSLGVAAEAPKA